MKKLSVIIPVYNCELYLKDCVDSILSSKKDLEILLVDDGSTDNSLSICKDYQKKDSRVKVFHKSNGGVSSARNLGLENCTGDYIMFVDSDDFLSEKWDNCINVIDDSDIYYFNSKIKNKPDKDNLLRYITGDNSENIFLSGPISKAFKRKFIINNNINFDNDLINGEDMVFNIKAAILAKTYEFAEYQFYNYRQSLTQSTKKFDERIIKSDKRFHELVSKYFEDAKINKTLSNEIKDFCILNAIVLLLIRISYISNYYEAKKFYKFLNDEPYNSSINRIKASNKMQKVLLYLCKHKQYKFIYILLKYKNIIKNIKKQEKKEFIKI